MSNIIKALEKQYGIQYEGRFICRICGRHKTHYRLHGYICDTRGHTEREHAFTEALIEARMKDRVSQREYELYVFGEEI